MLGNFFRRRRYRKVQALEAAKLIYPQDVYDMVMTIRHAVIARLPEHADEFQFGLNDDRSLPEVKHVPSGFTVAMRFRDLSEARVLAERLACQLYGTEAAS